jgi:hypothetical protein
MSMRTNSPGGQQTGPSDPRIVDTGGHVVSKDGAPNAKAPPNARYAPDEHTGNVETENRSVGDSPRGA